ncbi:MAG: hypothetical protein JXB32_20965 [Deltaproteobacteria bacterium]|nr:hypothetical protein [Deltaproteobacteria bacterium]
MSGRCFACGLLAILMLPLAACEEESGPETGDLHVTYRIGSGSTTCDAVGIRQARVYVLTSPTAPTAVRDATVNCDAADQSFLLHDLEVGRYYLRVEGRDADDHVIYVGTTTTTTEVLANRTNGPVMVIIEQIRPSIQLWVGFSDVGGCDRHGIASIQVVLYENGSTRTHDETYPCIERLDDSLLIEDLSETATYDIRVRAINDHTEPTYAYDRDGITVRPGDPEVVEAVLAACSGICSPP